MLKTVYNLLFNALQANFEAILKGFCAGNDLIIKYDKKNNCIKLYLKDLKRIDK
jgi:hypothetical protein